MHARRSEFPIAFFVLGAVRGKNLFEANEKLGFKPVDEIVVFSTGGWVFLSGGFTGA